MSGILGLALHPAICHGYSRGSTGSIKLAPANPEELAWGLPSPSTSCWRMGGRFAPRANSITARHLCSRCQLPSLRLPDFDPIVDNRNLPACNLLHPGPKYALLEYSTAKWRKREVVLMSTVSAKVLSPELTHT